MEEKDENSCPSERPAGFELCIQTIFKTIQKKLNKSSTQEGNGNMLTFTTNAASVSSPSGDASNPASSPPEQNHDASVGSLLSGQVEEKKMLELRNGKSESDSNRRDHPLQEHTHCDVKEEKDIMNSLERADHPQQEKESGSGVGEDDTNSSEKADRVTNSFLESKGSLEQTAMYRDPGDTDSDSDSDSDTSSLSSFEVEEPEPEKPEKVPRSKGEILPEELPPLQNLHISLTEETRLEELGVVTGIVGVLVVIESTVDLGLYSPLNEDSVLFYENRQPFGIVFDVFGPCKAPSYAVRFNSVADIEEKGIQSGLKVFFVPDPVPEVGTITHYVFVQKLKQIKGSDASWKGNNEPPHNLVEYSDDEEEKRSKVKRKSGRGNSRDSGEEEGEEGGEKQGKRGCRKRKERPQQSSNRPEGHESRRDAQSRHSSRHNQQFPAVHHDQQRHRGPFRGTEVPPVFRPAFNRPQNPVMDSAWGGPPPARARGPQTSGFSMGPPRNVGVRGPFSGGPGQGPFSDPAARPPFPGWPGSASFENPLGGPPFPSFTGGRGFSGGPSSGSFCYGPFSNPGSRPFGGNANSNPGYGSFGGGGGPPNNYSRGESTFSTDTSVPPPNLMPFEAGQFNSTPRNLPPTQPGPCHGWTNMPPPQGPYGP